MLTPATSEVILRIQVSATNWIPVDEVRVVSNGKVAAVFDAQSTPPVRPGPALPWSARDDSVLRFEHELVLHVVRDSWILVEAGAPLDPVPPPDPFAEQIVPGLIPLAFTNPIFIDLAGDGFDPPGVAAPAGPRLSAEALERHRAEAHRYHFPLHRIRIPAEAVEAARERLGF